MKNGLFSSHRSVLCITKSNNLWQRCIRILLKKDCRRHSHQETFRRNKQLNNKLINKQDNKREDGEKENYDKKTMYRNKASAVEPA